MSTLKVNKLRDTAGSADAIVLDPNGGAVLAGVTTVTSVKVGAAVTISESGIEASGIGITCANINGTQIGGRRNLVINGAMQVAQYATSYTGTNNYNTIDRIHLSNGNVDENCTFAQVDVASGTTPYSLGFRKALKVTNGNQTTGVDADANIQIQHRIEDQNMAQSGWNYTSSSSFITLQFWVKSSVAQNFYGYLRTRNGTEQIYNFETGSLTADTWTKIIKTVPGNSNLQFDNDNGRGIQFNLAPYWGTNFTDSGVSLGSWRAYANGTRTPDYGAAMDDWYLTNDATFEITGLQIEVGSQATPFEHRSFAEELTLCQRYFERITVDSSEIFFIGVNQFGSGGRITHEFKVTKRAIPTVSIDDASYRYYAVAGSASNGIADYSVAALTKERMQVGSNSSGASTSFWVNKESDGYIDASSEL